jgi:hypothetical protein
MKFTSHQQEQPPMTPIHAATTRTAYRDERDCLELTNVYIAAHLILAGHQLLQVIPRHHDSLLIFDLAAQPALDRLKLAFDEVLAHCERAKHEQERRQGARS